MKTLAILSLILANVALADEPSTPITLPIEAVNVVKALAAVPAEAEAFHRRTMLKSIQVTRTDAFHTTYVLSGKRLLTDAYRQLKIEETRAIAPAMTVKYEATLIP